MSDNKLSSYRVTDLPQLTDLRGQDLFLITHQKDLGGWESQSISFKRLMMAIKRRGFKDELSVLNSLAISAAMKSDVQAEAAERLAQDLSVAADARSYTDRKIAEVHTHDNYAVLSSITDTLVSRWENDAGYLISTDFSFSYSDRTIWLKAGANILSVDANDFIRDGMVESAYYDTDAREIVITFNTASGKSPIRIYIGDLVDVYTAGDGLQLVGNEFSIDDDVVAKRSWVEDKGYLTEHQPLTDYAKKTDIPTNVSQLTNDAGYLTEHQSLDAYAKKTDVPTKVSQLENDSGYLTAHQSLADYAKKTDIPTKVSVFENDAGYLTEHQSLAEYAKQKDIPTNVSQLANDANYVTEKALAGYALRKDIPIYVSQLENDAGYITSDGLPTKVSQLENDAGYQLRTVFRDWTEIPEV